MVRKLLLSILFSPLICFAQSGGPTVYTITGTGCTAPFDVSSSGVVGVSVANTATGSAWSGTIQPEVIIGGDSATNVQVTPYTSTTAQSTITANGMYRAGVSGANYFLLCGNTVTNSVKITVTAVKLASGLSGGGGGGSGTVGACAAAGNAFYSGAGTTVGCDTSVVDNGSGTVAMGLAAGNAGVLTLNGTTSGSVSLSTPATSGILNVNGALNLTGATAALATIATTNTNQSLTVTPNGTGLIIFPSGTSTNPSQNYAANASNTGWFAGSANAACWANTGSVKSCFNNGGNEVANNSSYAFSQSTTAVGTSGPNISVTGTGTTEYLDVSTPVIDLGKCQFTGTAIGNTATTLCTFTLPNAATTFRIDCPIAQIVGTATTLAYGYTFAQTPTNVSFSAEIKTTNTNTATEATITTANTSNNTILTGATPGGTGTFMTNIFGTFTSSATSGTLLITATAGAASDITETGGCWLH